LALGPIVVSVPCQRVRETTARAGVLHEMLQRGHSIPAS
jgi:hypothetical protein